jgi:LemA protein
MATLLIILGIVVLLIVISISIYNKFVKNRNIVKDAWSNIDVFLKKRHDLIPNLVETVKGYAAHEKKTLQQVIEARNQAVKVDADDINAKIAAENALQKTLRSIFALGEAYPDLKADTSFINLQNKLVQIETELERSRRYYNATVRDNNTYGESFPGVVFAGVFNYQHFDYFEVEDAERENVKVDFSTNT